MAKVVNSNVHVSPTNAERLIKIERLLEELAKLAPVQFTMFIPNADCDKCNYLAELYKQVKRTPRNYWLMTEIFVFMHGSDVCDC